jgi:hypothetical protein
LIALPPNNQEKKPETTLKTTIAVAALLLVMGCQQRMLINPNATHEQAARDNQECDYQAEMATATMREGLDRAFRRGELRVSCLKVRGYTQEVYVPR